MKKILIWRNGSFGDTLIALPTIKEIIKTNKKCKIYYLTFLNRDTIFFQPKKLFDSFGIKLKYKIFYKHDFSFLKFLYFFFQKKFDKLYYLKESPINFFNSLDSSFLVLRIFLEKIFLNLLLIKNITGLEYKNFKKKKLKSHYKKEYSSLFYRIFKNDLNEEKFLSSINNLFCNYNKTPKNIVICVGGKYSIKDWGVTNWVELIEKILKYKKNTKITLIGSGRNEKNYCLQINKNFNGKLELFFDKPLKQLINKLLQAKLYLGHDTANMHLASMLKIRTVAIFSSTQLEGVWYPLGNNNLNFYKKIHCSNCQLTETCPFNKKCINSFTPNFIFKKIKSLI